MLWWKQRENSSGTEKKYCQENQKTNEFVSLKVTEWKQR